MNLQLADTQKVPFKLIELDGDLNPAEGAPTDRVTVLSSDPASATVALDPTPAAGSVASGFVLGGKKLQNGVVITATVTHADGTNFSATGVLDIIAGVAVSVSFNFGT